MNHLKKDIEFAEDFKELQALCARLAEEVVEIRARLVAMETRERDRE